MKVLSYTEARQNFASTLDAVVDDAEETVIHRAGHEPVVVVSLRHWAALKETEFVNSRPELVEQLSKAIAELEGGKGTPHELIELLDEAEAGAA